MLHASLKNLIVLVFLIGLVRTESNADIINKDVRRTIDLTTHLVKISNLITVENQGSQPLVSYTFVVEPSQADNLAYLSAKLFDEKDEDAKNELKVSQNTGAQAKGLFYKIEFKTPVSQGKTLKFVVEASFIRSLRLYPSEITQYEKQYVLYTGNSYYYSLYATKSQVAKFNLETDKVESFTQVKPTSKTDRTITYGPYENLKQFEQNEVKIHYENNSPFLAVSNIVRVIEVSHWGNIAVEEVIDMYHTGAKLKGPFHRIDFMKRVGGVSSVKSFKTVLPRTASDVYYRDEIGNISTSNLRYSSGSAELEIRPRFPLFGGWKTHYTVGYNVPTYQYLYNKGNEFLLKMKLIDHVYDDQLIEHLTVKIILPEHSKKINFKAPYEVKRDKDSLHFTYLDVIGRPVVVIHKNNAVEEHIQDFELRYTFDKFELIKEPMYLVGFFMFLFTLVIIIVRIDFSITNDPNKDLRLKVKSYWEQVIKLQERRDGSYFSLEEAIEQYKSSKGGKAAVEKRKKIEADLKQVSTEADNLIAQMKPLNAESAEKIVQLNQFDKQLSEHYQKLFDLAVRLVGETIKKDDYLEARKPIQAKIVDLTSKITNMVFQ